MTLGIWGNLVDIIVFKEMQKVVSKITGILLHNCNGHYISSFQAHTTQFQASTISRLP